VFSFIVAVAAVPPPDGGLVGAAVTPGVSVASSCCVGGMVAVGRDVLVAASVAVGWSVAVGTSVLVGAEVVGKTSGDGLVSVGARVGLLQPVESSVAIITKIISRAILSFMLPPKIVIYERMKINEVLTSIILILLITQSVNMFITHTKPNTLVFEDMIILNSSIRLSGEF
jgi:hypothetical protein